jgi:hypothetical protein
MPITLLSAHECFEDLAQKISAELEKTHGDIVEAVNMSPSGKAQLTITVPIEFAPNTHQFTISSVVTPLMPCFRRKVTCQGEDKNQTLLAIKATGTNVVPPEGEPIEVEDEPETSAATTGVSPIAGAQEVRKADPVKKPRGRPKKVQTTEAAPAGMEPIADTLVSVAAKQQEDATADSVWPAEPFKDSFAAPAPPAADPTDDDVPPED